MTSCNRAHDDAVAVCQFCGEAIDQADMSVEAFEIAAAPCCVECAVDLYSREDAA